MIIKIDKQSSVPIYTQLINQLKYLIVTNKLKDNDSLPSVRSLARDLGVNMHTVNKAYNILVEEHVLIKIRKGYIVSSDRQITDEGLEELDHRITELLLDIYVHHVSDNYIKELFDKNASELKKE